LEQKARSLQQAGEDAAKGARQKDDSLGNVGRELKNPIHQARTSLESLSRGEVGGPLNPAQMGALRATQERLEAVQHLVEDLNVLGEGQRAPSLRPVNLSEIAKQVAGRMAVEAR